MLIDVEEHNEQGIVICPNGSIGESIELCGLHVVLPAAPKDEEIAYHDLPKEEQYWRRQELPEKLLRVKSMDDWLEAPKEFRKKFRPHVEMEFERRRVGFWFFNSGVRTYISGHHYMFLQWSRIDIGYPHYLSFQRDLFLHMSACEVDSRCMGQLYVKCRRSGYTNMCASSIVDEGTQVKEKLLGIQSKTGKDAQENIFMKKIVPIFRSYPFFFKPIQDGTTNPRMELAFREPSKRITKKNKTSTRGEALNTIINWKNTTNNAYDGEKVHWLYLDEAGKWERPTDIREAWRIQRTCLIVGRRIVGKAMVGSTVNPLDKGGSQYKKIWIDSDPLERNANGRTVSGLYRIFVPAHDALEGFFDRHGNAVVDDPSSPIEGIDGEMIAFGAKTFLKNERSAMRNDARELNEFIRQFPFSPEEAFRDSVESSLFNIGKIYEQIEYNDNLYPQPFVEGNFVWESGKRDTKVLFRPTVGGRWKIGWMPLPELRNIKKIERGNMVAPNSRFGCGGVDSYDLDATVDNRGSKGACHLYNKFSMEHPSNIFVAEYISRPPMAKIFYEDILMASYFYGYPLLIENNKYGIVRYFEERGYDGYVLDRPAHLRSTSSSVNVKTKGIPSNSQDVIQSHAQAIEDYIHQYVGSSEDGSIGVMPFNRTLEDWVGFKINDRTKYDLSISSGLALLAAQKVDKEKPKSTFNEKEFFRSYKYNGIGGPSILNK